MKKSPNPTFDQVSAWCDQHDNHAIQGWLTSLLDGTYTVDEMRAAVLADRAPTPARNLDDTDKLLVDAVLDLPDYRGWHVWREEREPHDMNETIVWKHDDYDTKIWLDLKRKSAEQIDLSIDVDDPNDDPYCPHGDYVTLPEHTAEAVFAACKSLLDEYSYDDDDDSADAAEAKEAP